MIRWSASTLGNYRSICAELPNGSYVSFTSTPGKNALYGEHWRATHRHRTGDRTVGGFELRDDSADRFAEWLDRIAHEAAKRGPETVRDLGWY